MGYMQGVTKRGIDFVSRITGLLNNLTEEDFQDTHVGLRVMLVEDNGRELGFWSNEYGYGNWAYFDEALHRPVTVEELVEIIGYGARTPEDIDKLARNLKNYFESRSRI